MEEFNPNIKQLPKKRQFEILVFGYDPDNIEVYGINTKVMLLTQNFIYDTKLSSHPIKLSFFILGRGD